MSGGCSGARPERASKVAERCQLCAKDSEWHFTSGQYQIWRGLRMEEGSRVDLCHEHALQLRDDIDWYSRNEAWRMKMSL